MGRIIDLRSYNIKSDEDVVEFLDLFEQKIPQIKNYLKQGRLRRISLENQVSYLNSELHKNEPRYEVIDPDASVTERLEGNTRTVQSDEAKRLAQLKQAQEVGETEEQDDLAPPAPGEIGQLHVANIEGHAPTEQEVVAAAGSKSERSDNDSDEQPTEAPEVEGKVYTQFQLDDDVYQQVVKGDEVRYTKNSQDINVTDFEIAQALAEGAPIPSGDDIRGVGDIVAEATDNGKNRD